jgi:translation elongation factor EF-Tu-like GTPase
MVGCTHLDVVREHLSMSNPSFTLTVQHVFYIKPPIDRVMVVGVVDQGTVRPGDAAVIEGSGRAMRATVEAIVALSMEEIPSAETGDQVALRFAGIPKDQVKAGDRVSSAGRLS